MAQTTDLNIDLKLAGMTEAVQVTGESPLVKTTDSSVGGVVDVGKIESLPLNGRQFANLAMTIPGVGLGFHSDPTKSTQYSPQIAGGNGRNVNYQIDGGDNNDDTVGGLLQLFPLEAIQEFNFVTQRYKAEYGRSNGGVMNIVTKSGTNNLKGSWFTMFRDKTLNARTETEKLTDVPKQDYRRYQFGGSFGGPILRDKAHFFGAFERTQQDTLQSVDTKGLFPDQDGVYTTPYRENLVTVKGTASLNASQYLSVRYGRNTNSQPYGVDPSTPPSGWGTSSNTFNSINANHNWVLGGAKLNEFIFQFAEFANAITANSLDPQVSFPNGVSIGQNTNTPQQTQQKKWQFRDDFTWSVPGMGGLSHGFKAGVNFINEPRLFITFNTGTGDYAYSLLTNDAERPGHRRHAQRRRGRVQHPDEAVRRLRPGRLEGQQQADAEPRVPLRPAHGVCDRSDEEPELRDPAGCRGGGPLRGPAGLPGLRQELQGGSQQLAASRGRRVRLERRRPGRHPRRLGPVLRRRIHERQHPVRGDQRDGHRRRPDIQRPQRERHPEVGRHAVPHRRSDQQHPVAERGWRRAAAEFAHRVAPHQAALLGPDDGRVVASARRRDGGRRGLHPFGGARPRLAHPVEPAQPRLRFAPVRRPAHQPGELHHRHQRRQEPL